MIYHSVFPTWRNIYFYWKGTSVWLQLSLFYVNWPRIGLYNLFLISKFTFQHHLHKIYMAFYLLTWTYFSGFYVNRNILINSQIKRILLLAVTRKSKTKLRITEKNTNGSDFSENEIPDSNSLKPFGFETKTNIDDITSSSSDEQVMQVK